MNAMQSSPTGIAHSEMNEASRTVHFLQIWVIPWKNGLTPRYHTMRFDEQEKRKAFVPIISPLAAGPEATQAQDNASIPKIPGTIPIHADFVMGAGIIEPSKTFEWIVGANAVSSMRKRKVYFHVPATQQFKAKICLDGREDAVLNGGDGAFVSEVNAGDKIRVQSMGEAEVIVLDSE